MDKAGDLLTMVHVADAYDHTASSGLRYIVNPPGSQVTVHQHLDIGQGEVDFDAVLRRPGAQRLRRHRHRLRLRVGGPGPRVEHLHARHDPLLPRQVGHRSPRSSPPKPPPADHLNQSAREGNAMSTPTRITHLIGGAARGRAPPSAPARSSTPRPASRPACSTSPRPTLVDEVVKAAATRPGRSWADASLAKRTQVLFALPRAAQRAQGGHRRAHHRRARQGALATPSAR